MKCRRLLLSLLASLSILSCGEHKVDSPKPLQVEGPKEVSSINKITSPGPLDKEIDVQNIKSQLDYVTTTFLAKEDVLIFPDMKNNQYFGHYTLAKKDAGDGSIDRVGHMIIYDSINPYVYEKRTDSFVEITLNKPGILLFDGDVRIGMTENQLLELMGHDYEMIGNLLFFKKNNKMAFFELENGALSKLKIGIYKNNVDINEIVESSKW
ncbi:MAG: hypothetical protein AAF466_02360 [Bacteroidota bacterium]